MPRKITRDLRKELPFRPLQSGPPSVGSEETAGSSGVGLYHVVYANEGFDLAAQAIFSLVKDAVRKFPGKPRHLYLDIEGHRNENNGFDNDMFELQQEFCIGFLLPWLTTLYIPLGAKIINPGEQREDLPEALLITNPHVE